VFGFVSAAFRHQFRSLNCNLFSILYHNAADRARSIYGARGFAPSRGGGLPAGIFPSS
jgi:hypothetical protein